VAVLVFADKKSIETKPLGVVILLVATVFSSGLYVVEEKLLGSYYLDPLKVVGLEGLWGTIMWCILLPIFQHIPCNIEDLCPFGVLEDSLRAIDDFSFNHNLIWLSVAVCFTMAMFNGFGVTVTKNASSAQRATIDTARTVLIWVFFMIVEVRHKKEKFSWIQLLGFVFLVIGTLVFNEIVIVPWFGFNEYTKEALAKRAVKGSGYGLLDQPNELGITGVSPLAS
jgi:drug/metabolite transporter (DMT)-like permease